MSGPVAEPAPPNDPRDVQYQPDGGGAWKVVLGVTFALSTLLGVLFFAQYSQTLSYVRTTLEDPASPPRWETEVLSPTECVDETMNWTAGCSGIKAMCDMYVDRIIALCLASAPREDYCARVIDETHSTRFGHEDCRLRGVQRNVNSEACAGAYRAIGSYCETMAAVAEQNAEPNATP